MAKLDKRSVLQRSRELRVLLNDWDPIGVGSGGPDDEYDCLLWPVLRMLEDNAGVDTLTSFLTVELHDHFGVDGRFAAPNDSAFRSRKWFDTWRDNDAEG